MPKKNFKQVADDNPALAFLGTQTSAVHDVQRKDTIKYCNINLRLRQDLKDYLNDASWQERTTMTQYLSDLIEADMKVKAGKKNV